MSATTIPTTTVSAPSGEAKQPKLFGVDHRFAAPILITLILLAGQLSFGVLESYPKTALAIITAILVELILGRVFAGKWPHLSSAYISGISVGILVRSPAIWPYALCSAISITSKYVLRVRDRHIWNPSNFGICALLFLAPFSVTSLSIQWGNNVWPMLVIWLLGSIIIYRLRRFHITLTYVVSFVAFSLLRSYLTGHTWQAEVAPITGPMYQLFIFFMITDPKTTVRSSRLAQMAVAFCVALVEMVLRLFEQVHAPYYALFIVGPIANLIEISLTSRRRSANPSNAVAHEHGKVNGLSNS
jgi:Na+-translocating ferredoxin:NAD+ oxidoreductase RnfD subunit